MCYCSDNVAENVFETVSCFNVFASVSEFRGSDWRVLNTDLSNGGARILFGVRSHGNHARMDRSGNAPLEPKWRLSQNCYGTLSGFPKHVFVVFCSTSTMETLILCMNPNPTKPTRSCKLKRAARTRSARANIRGLNHRRIKRAYLS
jgi:hypothetical protein